MTPRNPFTRRARATRLRRLSTLATIGCAGVLTLGACNIIQAPSASSVQSPSVATLKAVPYTPTPSLVVTRGCVASDFKVGNGASGAYQGDAVYSMALLNNSGIACSLNGAPPITLTMQSGAQALVALGDASSMAVDVAPGQILHIMVGAPGSCANPGVAQPASSISVNLPGGSVTDQSVNLDLECGTPTVLIFAAVDAPAATSPSSPSPIPSVGGCTWSQTDGCTYLSSTNGSTGSVTVVGGQWFGNVPPATAFSCTPVSSTTSNQETCTYTEPPSSTGTVTIIASKVSSGSATTN
jgi:Protein of unknown function (DUF4232)